MAGSEYYDHTTYPSTGAAGSSSAMRAELDAIENGFGKLPALSGNGSKIVAVNSGATGLEAITTTGTGSGVRATSPTLTTPVLGVATCTSLNGITFTTSTGTFALTNGKTLTWTNTGTISGTDGFTLNVGSGGALGTAAYTAATAYPSAAFTTIAVSGQSNVVADSTSDTLTLAAGPGTTITTDASTDTITIAVSSAEQVSKVTSQFDKTSDTALANVTGLSATLVSGETYEFVAKLHTSIDTGGGVKVAIGGTATASSYVHSASIFSATWGNSSISRVTTLGNSSGSSNQIHYVELVGAITASGNGTITVQFAQNASNATTNSVLVGSTFAVRKIS